MNASTSTNFMDTKKFYDLEPAGKDAGHYLCENGVQIARFTSLATAEVARQEFMIKEAQKIEAAYREMGPSF